jgi:hypothetical protein
MKRASFAIALIAGLAAAPALAADADDATYAPMYSYGAGNPHAKAVPPAVEAAADAKAAQAQRDEVSSWSSVMGQGDIPQEYLKGHAGN